ncbi:hypothetical protein H0H81_000836 [Sphagnurus paluster]|uniref:Uncharacterized protein n=1 Tax=Sphagnurus paluster TaxID=117069 RepID=A0A9P7KHR8_9AGAR|nr:hypothetical protein H0H81_000836 [Sphagnurus paluster]
MSVSVGGLGLMSLRNPFAELVGTVLGKTDLRSMLCLIVFFIVISVLAYLTNPTENSFRAYLTEQSFRRHLSRLDEGADVESKQQTTPASRGSTLPVAHTLSYDNSFGLFTIAAMVPLARTIRPDQREHLIISDSWYVGAFGRWWRGGIIEAWYHDVIARTKDEESWSSGILSMKNLDKLTEFNGLPFSTKNLPPHLFSRGSPPTLRNRERSSQRPAILPARSSTPPPLPKSASLPLHTARMPPLIPPLNTAQPLLHAHTTIAAHQVQLGSPLLSRSPSALFDQSPRIAEVLRQIAHSKTTVLELRTQLGDCETCASQSHSVLQAEVGLFRERKRQEDASKLETKSRTKALDDSRRGAESLRRDAEKKLKAAQNARENATQRMDHLDKEIAKLKQRLVDDEKLMRKSEDTDAEKEITQVLQQKKEEIKVAEGVVVALNQRARELEEKLEEEKERLALLKERNQTRKLELSRQAVTQMSSTSWTAKEATHGPSIPEIKERHPIGLDGLGRRPSIQADATFKTSPTAMLSNATATQAALRANGYSVFDNSILTAGMNYHPPSTFSPFAGLDGLQVNMAGVISHTSQSLIPSALNTSFGDGAGLPRSFQSESDVYMDKEWRTGNSSTFQQIIQSRSNGSNEDIDVPMVTSSPVSQHDSSGHSAEHDSFEVRFLTSDIDYLRDCGYDQPISHQLSPENSMDMQRASWTNHTYADPYPYYTEVEPDQPALMEKAPRRWFSTKEKPKKGLNPDAKVFSLARKSPSRSLAPGSVFNLSPSRNAAVTAYDALNPTGLGSTVMPAPGTVTSSFTRAFAPSPAEREALQRALGGSTNASFERLPSLSDVSSIPSSPSHVHALPTTVSHHSLSKLLPAWLQSLPPRKANFSPWDDEEPVAVGVSVGSGTGKRR